MSQAPEDERDLFGGSLHEFVARRKALASALRKQGDRAEAKRIASLKKPSVAVWALDQLAKAAPEELQAVLGAIERQRDLQIGALQGSLDPAALEEARGDERRGVSALLDRATALLEDDGHAASKTTLDRIATILRRVALDPERREALVGGRLSDEGEEPAGLEAVAAQLDPALLLAALQVKEPKKKKKRSGDSFLARTTRADRKAREQRPESKRADEREGEAHEAKAKREAAEEAARKREAARSRERARLSDKLAELRADMEQLDAELGRAQAKREVIEVELDAARKEVRRLKRKQAEERERVETLQRQLAELD